ncbi:thioredoxin [Enterobacteria phage vB_EcoM_IME540]|nr:thioredoxin [Enterobacteria phage vB_EcoM_IME540]
MFEQFIYNLYNAGLAHRDAMKQSVEDYDKEVVDGYTNRVYKTESEEGDYRRLLLAAKTQALINLDRKQVKLAGDFRDKQRAIRSDYQERIAQQRKTVTQSAWFSGQAGEKSFY